MTDDAESSQWHMVPIEESSDHEYSEDCWCDPQLQGRTPEGCDVFLHFPKSERTLQ